MTFSMLRFLIIFSSKPRFSVSASYFNELCCPDVDTGDLVHKLQLISNMHGDQVVLLVPLDSTHASHQVEESQGAFSQPDEKYK